MVFLAVRAGRRGLIWAVVAVSSWPKRSGSVDTAVAEPECRFPASCVTGVAVRAGWSIDAIELSYDTTACPGIIEHISSQAGSAYTTYGSDSIMWGDVGAEIILVIGSETPGTGPNTTSVTFTDIEGGWPGTNNFDADPRFVDAQGGDMRLRALSPARGAAENGSDLGAYQYGS